MNIEVIARPYHEDPTWDEIRIVLEQRYIGHVLMPRKATRKEKADAVHRFVESYRHATRGGK